MSFKPLFSSEYIRNWLLQNNSNELDQLNVICEKDRYGYCPYTLQKYTHTWKKFENIDELMDSIISKNPILIFNVYHRERNLDIEKSFLLQELSIILTDFQKVKNKTMEIIHFYDSIFIPYQIRCSLVYKTYREYYYDDTTFPTTFFMNLFKQMEDILNYIITELKMKNITQNLNQVKLE